MHEIASENIPVVPCSSNRRNKTTQKEEKFKKEDEPLLCLKFINIYIFICDRKEEEQLTLPRIITPAFSRMDPGRQEGAFLQVISLDC